MTTKKLFIILLTFFTILTISGCSNKNNFKSDDEYIYNMHTFARTVKLSYNECHELGLRIADIWHDAIMEELDVNTLQYTYDTETEKYRDFNDALSYYVQSDEYKHYKNYITTTKDNLLNLYTLLSNLPDKYSDDHEYIKKIYDSYILYENSMLNPSGTYNEFAKLVNANNNITTLCDTLNALIPDYENNSYSFEDKDLYIPFYYGLRYGKYTGNFSNGNVNGKGTFSSTNTDGTTWIYTGNFKDGHFSGKGKTEWSDGSSYEGEYKNDLANGQGTYTTSDGSVNKGTFKDDNLISK